MLAARINVREKTSSLPTHITSSMLAARKMHFVREKPPERFGYERERKLTATRVVNAIRTWQLAPV
jgi:hypothetical protein